MFKLIFILSILGIALAYESYGSRSGSYGSGGSRRGSYGRVIPLAVQSRRSIKFITVPTSYDNYEPLTLEIPSSSQPLTLLMNTKSSPLNIQTSHQPGRGSYVETSSVDEPHIRRHTVHRPVHQYVTEILTPYRKVRMEVQPLQEEREQVVARKAYGSNSGGYSSSSYSQRSGGHRRY